jgi:hypothetical protein
MSGMNTFLSRIRVLLADFVHGVDAGNAIRHGLAPSPVDPARAKRY